MPSTLGILTSRNSSFLTFQEHGDDTRTIHLSPVCKIHCLMAPRSLHQALMQNHSIRETVLHVQDMWYSNTQCTGCGRFFPSRFTFQFWCLSSTTQRRLCDCKHALTPCLAAKRSHLVTHEFPLYPLHLFPFFITNAVSTETLHDAYRYLGMHNTS